MVAFRHVPAWSEIWLLLPALAAIIVFVSALAVFLSAINVYLRDTQHLIEVLLVAWFWTNPVVYGFTTRIHSSLERHTIFFIPGTRLIWLYFANPVTPVVMTFQRVFWNVVHPRYTFTTGSLAHKLIPNGVMARYGIHWYVGADLAVLAVSLVLLLGAMVVFGRLEGNFAEEL